HVHDPIIPLSHRMSTRLKVLLPTPPIGYVRVELGRRQVGVPVHLLHRTEVGAPFQQMGGEGVAEQVWMYALGLEAGFAGELAQDQEDAGAREAAALGGEEELRPVAGVEMGPGPAQVTATPLCEPPPAPAAP